MNGSSMDAFRAAAELPDQPEDCEHGIPEYAKCPDCIERRKNDHIDALDAEIERLGAIAGAALGTDPDLWSNECVEVLAKHAEWLREELEKARKEITALRADREALAHGVVEGVEINEIHEDTVALARRVLAERDKP